MGKRSVSLYCSSKTNFIFIFKYYFILGYLCSIIFREDYPIFLSVDIVFFISRYLTDYFSRIPIYALYNIKDHSLLSSLVLLDLISMIYYITPDYFPRSYLPLVSDSDLLRFSLVFLVPSFHGYSNFILFRDTYTRFHS